MIYTIAYYNWYDEVIQLTEEEASSGLEAMKNFNAAPKLDKITDEEKYCQEVIKSGGFIGYIEKS